MSVTLPPRADAGGSPRLGAMLVFLSALTWSLGGMFARFIETPDLWTQVFWRSFWAAVLLLLFMLVRDGIAGTRKLFMNMGLPGLAVAACFAFCSAAFVVALGYTTVANVTLMAASVPLIAALISWLVLGEPVSRMTWAAIFAVLVGISVMVSDSFTGTVNPIGDGLALLIAIFFAIATVITRRFSNIRMAPATCLGVIVAGAFAALNASALAVSSADMGWLVCFGALNLGLGFVLFTTGARLVAAPIAALIGTFEPVLSPLWVLVVHGEVPSSRTIVGGAIIITALIVHILLQFARRRPAPQAVVAGR